MTELATPVPPPEQSSTKRQRVALHGWLNLDKPLGLSSTQALSAVRRILSPRKSGHGGTLDPLASGVLPIALGEATKTVSFLMDAAKTYRLTVRWGEARDTCDGEGAITATSDHRPTDAEIAGALPAFTGPIQQAPPAFSAIKVAGRRAYAMARAGDHVELPPRPVVIHRISPIETPDRDHTVFEVECGKGTYMRSLARDLALHLGTCGHVAALRRTAVGGFTEAGAISLDMLSELGHSAAAQRAILPIPTALADIPALALSGDAADRLRHGQAVPVPQDCTIGRPNGVGEGATVLAVSAATPVALARIVGGTVRPVRVLNM